MKKEKESIKRKEKMNFLLRISRMVRYEKGLFVSLFFLTITAGQASAADIQNLSAIKAEKVGMSSERLEGMIALGERYIENNQVAGMVNLVMRNGKVVHYAA